MITVLASPDRDALSAARLCEVVPLSLLNGTVAYRVWSRSMAPTLLVGDRLEIGLSTVLNPGDLLVYAVQSRLVCHRLRSIQADGNLLVSGDAAPERCESIAPEQVRGIVTAVSHGPRPVTSMIHQSVVSAIHRLILGRVGRVLVPLLRRAVTIAVLVPSPLRSCSLSQTIHRSRLSTSDHLLSVLHHVRIPLDRAQIHARLGGFTLASFSCATGRIDIGSVARRLGLDTYFQTLQRGLETTR